MPAFQRAFFFFAPGVGAGHARPEAPGNASRLPKPYSILLSRSPIGADNLHSSQTR
jgi:hypothetical protein